MANFADPERLQRAAANPAAPSGLSQTATRFGQEQSKWAPGTGQLQPWLPATSYLETAKSWYTGANTEGTTNGWDTPFYKAMWAQRDEYVTRAAQANEGRGDPTVFFDWLNPAKNERATGVATWDDPTVKVQTDKGEKTLAFGDVFENGQWKGNVYQDYDEPTADLMMGEFLENISQDVKVRAFEDPERQRIYRDMVTQQRSANSEQAKYAKSQQEFADATSLNEQQLRDHGAPIATTLGGAVAAGATAAALTSWTGPGALVAGLVTTGATLIGGISAYLNQDQIIEMAARGQAKVDKANEAGGKLQALFTGISEGGAVGSKLISPLSNTVQGLTDAKRGKVGDMTSEFYEVDPNTGERQISNWVQAADVVATLGDSALTFSSGAGRMMYMGSMGAQTIGGAGNIGTSVFTQAGGFNEAKGQFDKYEGWKEWSSAVANVGIDAVQLGTAGLLGRAAASSRAAFGKEAEVLVGREATVNGIKYTLDDLGRATSAKFTLEALAPSEFLRWVPTSFRARVMHDANRGMPIYDDLYRASLELSKGGSTFKDAVINGYAEGGEEWFQAGFERAQFGEQATWGERTQAALYGAAGGMGMSLGAKNQKAKTAQIQEARARTLMTIRQGKVYTNEEWGQLYGRATQADKDRMAIANPDEMEKVVNHLQELKTVHSYDAAYASTIGLMAASDMKMSAFEKGLQKSNEEGEGSLILLGQANEYITHIDGSIGKVKHVPNSAVMSAWEAVNQIYGINEGMNAMVTGAAQERVDLDAQKASLTDAMGKTNDQDIKDNLQHKLDALQDLYAELDDREASLKNQVAASDEIVKKFDGLYNQLQNLTDVTDVENHIATMNRLLQKAFRGEWTDNNKQKYPPEMQEAIQRSVELKEGRHPFIDTGSLAILMPQISLKMTELGQHGVAYNHQATLKVAQADHDGDTIVPQHGAYLSPAAIKTFRRGQQYTHPVTAEDGTITLEVVADPVDNEQAYLNLINDSLNDTTGAIHLAVQDELQKLEQDFMTQFAQSRTGPLPDNLVEDALRQFVDQAYGGVADARANLANAIVNIDPSAFFEMADTRHEPQVLWIMSRINKAFDGIQRRVAHYDALNPQNVVIADTPARLPGDNQWQQDKARRDAQSAGTTLGMAGTNAGVRGGQTLHYSALYNSTVLAAPLVTGGYTTQQHDDLVVEYENLGSGKVRSDMAELMARHSIEQRVVDWLTGMAEELVRGSTTTVPEIKLLLANTRVPNVKRFEDRHVVVEGEITLLQLLLQKSLDIEENINRRAEPDSDINKKIAKLRRLTQPAGDHSYAASEAVLEVFGNHQLFNLVGDSSMYIAPQMTLNQLMLQMAGLAPEARNQMLHTLERSPVYFSHNKMGDPPWSADVLESGQINAFTMLLDAVRVGAQTDVKNMRKQQDAAHGKFTQGLRTLHEAMQAWRELRGGELPTTDGTISDRTVLTDLLENRPEFSQLIVDIVPDASKMGVFKLDPTTQKMHVATWVEEALLERDVDKAELIWWFNSKVAEFNTLGGTIDPKKREQGEHATKGVRYGRIQSRFVQSLFQVAAKPDGVELTNLIEAYQNSPSLEKFMEKVNGNAAWRGPRADLLPYHDDVALFEKDPRDVWNQNLPSSLQRENLDAWGTQMAIKGKVLVEAAANYADNKTLLENIHAHVHPAPKQGVLDPQIQENTGAATYWGLLKKAIENRRLFPDVQGQAARDQITELFQEALVRMHDKGKADPRAAAWGEAYVTVDSFGWRDGLSLEANALTALDFEDIRVNPTLLVDAPIRAMMSDGSMVELDMSTPEGALEMLRDPRTQQFAMAVLFPTVRDVNNANINQTYLDADDTGSIAKLLEDQNFGFMFDERGTKSERVQQAHRYIGAIEGYVRKKTAKLPREERAVKFAPLQNMINDFITAYSHGPKTQHMNQEALRDQLFIDIAEAIKAVNATAELSREVLKSTILGVLEERYLASTQTLDRLAMDDLQRAVLDNGLRRHLTRWYGERQAEIDELEDAVTNQAEMDEAIRQREETEEIMERMQASSGSLVPTHVYMSLNSVVNMYTMDLDPEADAIRKQEMLQFIGTQNRMNRFRDKGAPIELIHKIRRAVWQDRLSILDDDKITPEEWEMLGEWCIQVYIADSAVRTGASVALNPVVLGEKGDQTRKYFDKTWGYLIDTLFDEDVLEAADFMAKRNEYNMIKTNKETAKILQSTLLSEDRLGEWTDRIPMDSLKNRQVLLNSPVGAAVALAGNLPKEQFDNLGSSTYTFRKPKPEHFSSHQMAGGPNDTVATMLANTPLAYISLQNHFTSKILLTMDDGTQWDLFQWVAQQNYTNIEVENSGLRVLDLTRLDAAITDLRANNGMTGGFTIDIDYVDVNKQPGNREYASNIFFDGVGRDNVAGASLSATAALWFGVNGISKIAQQNPLDMAAKAGKAFMQYITTTLDIVKGLETKGAPIAEQLSNKAMHMWKQEYDTGFLLPSDLPALYKLMKMRHVVVGYDVNGKKQVWWPEQAIEIETAGGTIPLTNMQLVPLSDSVAQTLRGGGSYMGIKGAMTKPVLNLQDLDNWPDLGVLRLEQLGLTKLGETTKPSNSPFAQIAAPPKSVMTDERGAALHTRYMQRTETWREGALPWLQKRSVERGKGAGKFDIREQTGRLAKTINELLTYENMGPLLMRRGISHQQLLDPSAVKVSKALVAQVGNMMEDDNNVIWSLVHGAGRNPSEGVLSIEDLRQSFANPSTRTPIFGDAVIVDLGAIMAGNGQNLEAAFDQAKDVIRMLANHGVTVVLGSKTGEFKLRNDLAAWMKSGNLGYRSISRSPNFFAPILTGEEYGVTKNAMASVLTETRHFSARGLELNLVSRLPGTDVNENMTRIDTKNSKAWRRIVHNILPLAIDGTGKAGGTDQYSYNVPVAGIDDLDQKSRVAEELLVLLRTKEGRAHLKAQASGEANGTGDPEKVKRWYKKNKNGTTDPGILPMDTAMDELQAQLESGRMPTDTGERLMTGSLVPLAGADGSILIARIGFKLPDMLQLPKQLESGLGNLKPEKGVPRVNIAIATDKLDKSQTTPPPFVVEQTDPDGKGLSVRGHYTQGLLSKMIFEGLGFKAGLSALTEGMRFHEEPMSNNGTRVTMISSEQSIYGKQATNRIADNLSTVFAVTGIDFREDMVNLFYGEPVVPREKKEFEALWNNTKVILDQWAELDSPYSADDIARALDAGSAARAFVSEINAIGAQVDASWQRLELEQDPKAGQDPLKRLGEVIIATLAIPGVRVDDVISGSGLMSLQSRDSDAKITELPQVMTQALNDPSYPKLREMLVGRANSHFPKDDRGNPLMYFEPDFTFHQRMQQLAKDGKTWVDLDQKGQLQIVLPIAADENSVGITQAALTTTTEVSPHIAATVSSAAAARTQQRPRKPLKKGESRLPTEVEELFGDNDIIRFDTDAGDTFWSLLTQTLDLSTDYVPWERALPMEQMNLREGDAEVRAYTTPIDTTPRDKDPWTKEELIQVGDAADEILEILNLKTENGRERIEVDYLVRQFWGRPGPYVGQKDWYEQITPKLYLEAVSLMKDNLENDMHPLHGGAVSREHHAFWKKVYFAQRGLAEASRWRPVTFHDGKRGDFANTWEEWNTALSGQVLNSNKAMHEMWRAAMDGFWHTYQGTTPSFQGQMFSTEQMVSMKMMDPDTNEVYLSTSPGTRALLASPVILDSMEVTYKALAGHPTSPSTEAARTVRTSELSEQVRAQKKWLKDQKLTPQRDMSVRQYAKEGARYTDDTRHTNAFLRGAVNAQLTMRLMNPQLYFSAIFEVPFRNALEHATNVLTGGNIAIGGATTSRAANSKILSGALGAAGIEPKFTPEQVKALNRLSKDLGGNNEFLGELYSEMIYNKYVEAGGESKLGSFFEWSAQAAARITSDPRWGMRAPSVGKRYIEAAWEYLSMTDSLITVEQFIELLQRDPLWLKNNSPEGKSMSAHQMGVNRVAQVRSTKATVASRLIMKPIDSLCGSSSGVANFAGHLLKVPFMFTRFNMNAFMTLTGLGGFDQMAAMMMHGRKPAVFKRIKALAQLDMHADVSEVAPMDMSEIIESIDLSRAFVRGAITQTGFMALGTLAGNLGLDGEDDEEKRRRRLAENLHIPYLRDPRRAANDFRWVDAIFLDNVPGLNSFFKDETGHSAVVPHWILRQFLSPILGMTRFYETGDVREIGYGFWDAASALPNSALNLWKEADLTAKLLADAAQAETGIGTPEKDAQVNQLLVNIVGMYEKALLENSFVNSLINAQDDYDRDPWKVPMTAQENTGKLDRTQGANLPQQTNAMQTYVDPATGEPGPPGTPTEVPVPGARPDEVKQGYLTRQGWDAQAHAWTENNHTAGVIMSLITGQWSGESTYLRKNMVPKGQTVQMPESTQAEAEALVISAFQGLGGQVKRTKKEILYGLKKRDQDANIWWDQTALENEADSIFAAENGKDWAMSILDADGKEVITQAGGRGIYQSLWAGALDFNNPAIKGISITKEMRDKIAEEWLDELLQEGVDLGLSDESAAYRANRLWLGDFDDPGAPSLKKLLYDKRIPYTADADYYQQNTTYVIGPDGRPWATPFQRMNTLQAFGVPMPSEIRATIPGVTGLDARGNVIDLVRGINTGLAAIEPIPIEPEPDDKPLEKAMAKDRAPGDGSGGGGYRRYGRGGGGGGGGFDSGPFFQRMQPLPSGTAPRYDDIPMINTNTPYIRRAQVNRQRITSERGRLKQWQ